MKTTVICTAIASLALTLTACGSSGGGTPQPSLDGIQVIGTIQGTQASAALPAAAIALAKESHDPNPDCPTDDPANSINVDPTSYNVMLKRITLLGEAASGTADYDLFTAATIADAVAVDFVTSSTFTSSTTYPPAGTYDGIEIEVYFIGMTLPMVVPAINALEGQTAFFSTARTIRGYFDTVGNVVPRDVTFFAADPADPTTELEYWINRKLDDPNPYGLVAVTGTHPDQVLDLWADDNFWNRDPITICTRTTATCDAALFGADFTFTMADGSGTLVIPTTPSGLYTITFAFNVSDKFTFWQDVNEATELGTYRVGYDCGLRILFPNVEVSMSE